MKRYFLHPDSIRQLFDSIATHYDPINRLISLGLDIAWRRRAVHELCGIEGKILDIATGTGEIAIEVVRQSRMKRTVYAVDFSESMLGVAQKKVSAGSLDDHIFLLRADALRLPFHDKMFDACVMAFGLRNIPEKGVALSEMLRVTKPGGRIVILEFVMPNGHLASSIFSVYFKKILPLVAGWISGDQGAYEYLPRSILRFPSAASYVEIMRKAGLEDIRSSTFTLGMVALITGSKKTQ